MQNIYDLSLVIHRKGKTEKAGVKRFDACFYNFTAVQKISCL